MAATVREFLESATLTRVMVDRFLDPDARNLTSFDAEQDCASVRVSGPCPLGFPLVRFQDLHRLLNRDPS